MTKHTVKTLSLVMAMVLLMAATAQAVRIAVPENIADDTTTTEQFLQEQGEMMMKTRIEISKQHTLEKQEAQKQYLQKQATIVAKNIEQMNSQPKILNLMPKELPEQSSWQSQAITLILVFIVISSIIFFWYSMRPKIRKANEARLLVEKEEAELEARKTMTSYDDIAPKKDKKNVTAKSSVTLGVGHVIIDKPHNNNKENDK